MLVRIAVLGACLAAVQVAPQPAVGPEHRLDPLSPAGAWSVHTDKPGAKVRLSAAAEGLPVVVTATGRQEDYPKIRRDCAAPRDRRSYGRLHSRLRVRCPNPGPGWKRIAFVFYDDETRLPDYPDNPGKQQVIVHTVPVNEWVEFTDWLMSVRRATIRRLDLYLYELPPGEAHEYTWDLAKLDLVKGADDGVLFDPRVFARNKLKGAAGKPVGRVGRRLQVPVDCRRDRRVERTRTERRLRHRRLPLEVPAGSGDPAGEAGVVAGHSHGRTGGPPDHVQPDPGVVLRCFRLRTGAPVPGGRAFPGGDAFPGVVVPSRPGVGIPVGLAPVLRPVSRLFQQTREARRRLVRGG